MVDRSLKILFSAAIKPVTDRTASTTMKPDQYAEESEAEAEEDHETPSSFHSSELAA